MLAIGDCDCAWLPGCLAACPRAVREESLRDGLFGSSVRSQVEVDVSGNKKLEHMGVKVELIGLIELLQDRSNTYEFTSLVRELEAPGELQGSKAYPFEFTGVDKQYESYDGINVRLRYFVRVTIMRQYSSRVVHEETIRVHVGERSPAPCWPRAAGRAASSLRLRLVPSCQLLTVCLWLRGAATAEEPDVNNSIKMEVGIEDCLHIEFEYNKSKYHLKDAVLGKIFFLLVRIKVHACAALTHTHEHPPARPRAARTERAVLAALGC